MGDVFLATVGERPEVITITLDVLRERYTIERVGILHTEPNISKIAPSLADLKIELSREQVRYHEMAYENGDPLIDVDSEHAVDAYYRAVLGCLLDYRRQGDPLHLLVAGGRKAMSIYATLAAGQVFRSQDRIWTLISSPALVNQERQFHVPAGARDEVQLVRLPVNSVRLASAEVSAAEVIQQAEQSTSARFMGRLTRVEREICELLRQNPHCTTPDLADWTRKSERTIENQLSKIYSKMEGYFDDKVPRKRTVLIDLLRDQL